MYIIPLPDAVGELTEQWPSAAGAGVVRPAGRWRQAWCRFAANRLALLGLAIFLLLGAAAIAAPLITPADYADIRYVASAYAFPSRAHPFGVDAVGRDFFSRNIYAARVSLSIGLLTAIMSTLIGVPLGAIAGFFGGTADWVVQRLLEVFSVIPPFLVAILFSSLSDGGILQLVLVISLTGWATICRLARAELLSSREEDFVLAARALGAGHASIIVRHLLPNALGPIIVGFSLTVPAAISMEAGLSFLGIGVDPPTPSWGNMIADGVTYVNYYWHLALFPVLMLTTTVLGLSFVGDGLRDAFDPMFTV